VRVINGPIPPVIIIVVVSLLIIRGGFSRPVVYEIPGGFRGWVTISYRSPGCPRLRSEGIQVVVTIPPSGHACTSSDSQFPKWHRVDHVYIYEENQRMPLQFTIKGRGGMIWSDFFWEASENGSGKPVEGFFVGTEDELPVHLDHMPTLSQPIPSTATATP